MEIVPWVRSLSIRLEVVGFSLFGIGDKIELFDLGFVAFFAQFDINIFGFWHGEFGESVAVGAIANGSTGGKKSHVYPGEGLVGFGVIYINFLGYFFWGFWG